MITKINLCVYGVPLASVYKGWRRRRPAKAIGAARMGVLLGLQVLVGVHQEGRKGEGIGGEGEVAGGQGGRAKGGVQLGFPILVGFPFLFQEGEGGKERERGRKEGAAHPPPSPIRTAMGRGARHLLAPSH